MAGFNDLAVELVNLIFAFASWPHDYHALSVLCRRFHGLAQSYLYRALAVTFEHPKRTEAMLQRLLDDPTLRDKVHTLVFDYSVRAVYDSPEPPRSAWDRLRARRILGRCHSRSLLSASVTPSYTKLSSDIANKLRQLVPLLVNLRKLLMPHAHPECVSETVYWLERKRLWVPFRKHAVTYYHVWHEGSGQTLWDDLVDQPLHTLSATLPTRILPTALSRTLKVLHLHGARFYDFIASVSWKNALQGAESLEVLMLSNIYYSTDAPSTLLSDVQLPNLREIHMHRVRVWGWSVPEFWTFFQAHAATLEVLALSLRRAGKLRTKLSLRTLKLPSLRVLRLDTPSTVIEDVDDFVTRHNALRDVVVLREEDVRAAVPAKPRSTWRARKELWVFHRLFEGLEMSRPEFMPEIISRDRLSRRRSIVETS